MLFAFREKSYFQPSPTAKPNNNAIYVGQPISVKNVSYGELYTVGSGDDRINIVHVWGACGRGLSYDHI